jgi:excisionase family DNA binding protein
MCSLMNVLTVKEASERLRVSERTCWSLIKAGRLAATYVTQSTVRITEKSIEEFLLSSTAPLPTQGRRTDLEVSAASP